MSNAAAQTGSFQPYYPEIGVLALVPDFWGPGWQARHYILSRVARHFHVLWMEPAVEFRPLLRGQLRPKPRHDVLPGMEVYRPQWWLPALGKPQALAKLTFKARLERARQRLIAKGCKKIVLDLWRPDYAAALTLLPHDLSCYHIDDEYSFSEADLPLSPVEESLIRSAGQVFIHSSAMMEKKGQLNPNTQFSPNGVDFPAFSRSLREPEDMRNIPHPRIGYCGGLKKVLDWPLLLQLASRHPQWSFVFAGSVRPHAQVPGYISQLASLPNVFFLGRKDTAVLPAYIQSFDLCLMPYRCNGYTRYIYPLKLHEYLASGRPVVSSPIRTVQDFLDVVLPASTPAEWSQMIERGLSPQENTPERCAQRRRVAQAHDWDALVANIVVAMAGRLGIQHNAAGCCAAAEPKSVPALTL